MSYIGGYMRPDYVNADNGNPGILGLYQFVQQGFNAGKAQAQNERLAQLSQAAYNDTGAQQQQDVSDAIGIDPAFGYKLGATVGAQSAAEQQQAQLKRYGGIASAIFQAKQSGNNAGAEGLYQSVLPELAAMAAKNGGTAPPANLDAALADPKISGTMYQLAQMYGSGLPAAQKGVVIAPGGQLVNPTTGAQMASVPNRGQVVKGYYFDPNTGTASPIPIKGAQNGVGMAAPVPGNPQGAAGPNMSVPGTNGQNVTFDFPPGTPPEVIAAAKASAVANGDIAPGTQVGPQQQAPQGQPQTLAQAIGASGKGDVVSQRAQQIRELKARGIQMTPAQEQSYMLTGKAPTDLVGGDDSGGMSPDATYYAAWNYNLTGQMPPFGMGGSSARVAVYNEAAKIAREAGVSPQEMRTSQGRQKALQVSLNNLQKQSDVMERNVMTFNNNAQTFLDAAAQVNNGQFYDWNRIKNAAQLHTGNKEVAALAAARNLVAQEYAKIAAGATGAQGSSDTAQRHALDLIDHAQSLDQVKAVIDVLNRDVQGQVLAAHEKEASIQDLMGQFGPPQQIGQQGAPQPSAPAGIDSLLSKYAKYGTH